MIRGAFCFVDNDMFMLQNFCHKVPSLKACYPYENVLHGICLTYAWLMLECMDNVWIVHGICKAKYFDFLNMPGTCLSMLGFCHASSLYAWQMQGSGMECAWIKMKLSLHIQILCEIKCMSNAWHTFQTSGTLSIFSFTEHAQRNW